MSVGLTSEVIQLLYRVTPSLNFSQTMGELCAAIARGPDDSARITWDCDDIALLDFDAFRVIFGFSTDLPGDHQACITFAIGPPPDGQADPRATADHPALSLQVITWLQARFPFDDQHDQKLNHPLTPDLIDLAVERLLQPGITAAPPKPDPREMDRLLNRLTSELTTRAPSLIARAIASATPKPRQTAPGEPDKPAKPKGGLFWRKGQTAPTPIEAAPPKKAPTVNELSAVRNALYAGDAARATSGSRIAVQTRLVLQKLAILPAGLAKPNPKDKKPAPPQITDPTKH